MHIQSGGGSSVGYFCWRPSEKTAYWWSHNDDISAAIINIDGARLYFADNRKPLPRRVQSPPWLAKRAQTHNTDHWPVMKKGKKHSL
jgi:hypothetical protein